MGEETIRFGEDTAKLRLDSQRRVAVHRRGDAPAAADPASLVEAALENPRQFPPLRQALTPDDHVAVAVDPNLADPTPLIAPVIRHIESAGVDTSRITVVVAPHASITVPPGVAIEVHNPDAKERLAYVATTAGGRRVYLNRTVVEADQAVVLSEVRHDPQGGVTGGPGAIFPTFSDAATRAALLGESAAKHAEEAAEVGWLVGLPFFLSAIAGEGGGVAEVIGGPAETHRIARAALRDRWVATIDRRADVAVATLVGPSAKHTTAEFAAALTHASLAVNEGGVLVLLTDAAPDLGEGFALAQQLDDPGEARRRIGSDYADQTAAQLWLRAVQRHRVFVLCRWPEEMVEELFATPLQHAAQVQRLIDASGDCVLLPDANRLFPVLLDS